MYEDDYEYDYEDMLDRSDELYDRMRDDFICIQSEDDAKYCLSSYPTYVDRFMPLEYRYLLKENKWYQDTEQKR